MEHKRDGFFSITSVHRGDLTGEGYDTSKVDDATMETLARRMHDAYLEGSFWPDLEDIAYDLGIPKAVRNSHGDYAAINPPRRRSGGAGGLGRASPNHPP